MTRRVMAVGVFDLLHLGHVHYLNEAAKHGDELHVVVATDASVLSRKHEPVLPEAMRAELVSALKPVTTARVGHQSDHFKSVEEIQPDVLALGYDDYHRVNEIREELERRGLGKVEVVRMPKFEHDLGGSRRIIRRILDLYHSDRLRRLAVEAEAATGEPAPEGDTDASGTKGASL